VTAPSANRHGAPSPRTASEVLAGLGDAVHLVLDAGPTPGGLASTVLDLTGPVPRVIRPGAVTLGPDDLADG
jgi:L-threonylcarbamoyladenylate synthase